MVCFYAQQSLNNLVDIKNAMWVNPLPKLKTILTNFCKIIEIPSNQRKSSNDNH